MSSHVQSTGNPSSQQAHPPEQPSEQQLFEKIVKAYLPYYQDMEDMHEQSSFLISNLKGQYDVLRDSVSNINSCCNGGDVVEMRSESLIRFYEGILGQIDVIGVLNDFQINQYLSLKSEKKQLQKRLFSMERELATALETNTQYYAQIQKLKSGLTIDLSENKGG